MKKHSTCLEFSYSQIIYGGFDLFLAMSTKHFAFVYPHLGINIIYSDELRLLSRKFAENALPTMGLSTPWIKAIYEDFDKTKFHELWQQLFVDLDKQGLADIACRSVETLSREEQLIGINIRTSDWNSLLVNWALDRLDLATRRIHISHLPLPEGIIKDIKILVLKKAYIDQTFLFHKFKDHIEMDEWENYALEKRGVDKWFILRAGINRTLIFWINIFEFLSDEQLEVLDKWGFDNIENNYQGTSYFSLKEHLHKLENEGYL